MLGMVSIIRGTFTPTCHFAHNIDTDSEKGLVNKS